MSPILMASSRQAAPRRAPRVARGPLDQSRCGAERLPGTASGAPQARPQARPPSSVSLYLRGLGGTRVAAATAALATSCRRG